jgi:hypothetical protein
MTRTQIVLLAIAAALAALTQAAAPNLAGAESTEPGYCSSLEWVWEVALCEKKNGGGGDGSTEGDATATADTGAPSGANDAEASGRAGSLIESVGEPAHDDGHEYFELKYLQEDYERCAEIDARIDLERLKRNPPRHTSVIGRVRAFRNFFQDTEVDYWRGARLNVQWRRLRCDRIYDLTNVPALPAED